MGQKTFLKRQRGAQWEERGRLNWLSLCAAVFEYRWEAFLLAGHFFNDSRKWFPIPEKWIKAFSKWEWKFSECQQREHRETLNKCFLTLWLFNQSRKRCCYKKYFWFFENQFEKFFSLNLSFNLLLSFILKELRFRMKPKKSIFSFCKIWQIKLSVYNWTFWKSHWKLYKYAKNCFFRLYSELWFKALRHSIEAQ